MDKKIIFVRTSKGEDEFKSKTSHLFGDIKRVLGLIDDKSTVEELTKRAAPSLHASFDDMLQELANGVFIQGKDKDSSVLKVVTPKAMPGMPTLKIAMPDAFPKDSGEELDFIGVMPKMTEEALAAEEAKAKAQMAIQEQANRDRLAAEAKARAEAEGKAKQEAEAKARAEAETARLKAEQEAAKAKAELAAVQARAKKETEATIPVKFRLFRADGRTPIGNATATITVHNIGNGQAIPIQSTGPSAGTVFGYEADDQHYQFNLKTRNWSPGTYRITASLDDGSTITTTVVAR